GRVGVAIFFCLSGYLIAQSLRSDDWRRAFPVKRALRLYPLFIVSVLGVLLVYQRPFSTVEALANLTMLPSFFGQPQYLELYWTLETEIVFYALFYSLKLCGLVEQPKSL